MYNSHIMKIVKLNRRHTAFNYGFTYALRYDDSHIQSAEASFGNVKKKLEEMYGHPSWDDRKARYHPWMYVWGKRSPKTGLRIKWIHLKDEADISALILMGLIDESN
jgi:hypothetical protein